MKKRLITVLKRILAVLAISVLGLASVSPAVASPETRSAVIALDPGSTNSGTYKITLGDAETVFVQMEVNGVSYKRSYSLEGPQVAFDSPQVFENLLPGDTIRVCLRNELGEYCSSIYTVPGVVPPADSDNDGVTDANDKCPGTPAGTKVDASGCAVVVPPADSDNDGVTDANDKCPGTPAGTKVDASGCAVVVPPATKTIHAKSSSIADSLAEAGEGAAITGGQFNITQVTIAPPSISVTLSDDSTVVVALSKLAGKTAQYDLQLAPGVLIVGATAVIQADWTGQFVLSHYDVDASTPPVDECADSSHHADQTGCEPPKTCHKGMVWTDANDNRKVDDGECGAYNPPKTCPEGKVWKDANNNGVVDDGECGKSVVTPPIVPPAVVPPVVTPPAVVPPAVVPAVTGAKTKTDVDKTNGRGVYVDGAATEQSSSVQQLGVPVILVGMTLIAGMLVRRRMATTE